MILSMTFERSTSIMHSVQLQGYPSGTVRGALNKVTTGTKFCSQLEVPRTTETPGSMKQAVLRQLEQATRPTRMEKASPISSLTMGMALKTPWARSSSFTMK